MLWLCCPAGHLRIAEVSKRRAGSRVSVDKSQAFPTHHFARVRRNRESITHKPLLARDQNAQAQREVHPRRHRH